MNVLCARALLSTALVALLAGACNDTSITDLGGDLPLVDASTDAQPDLTFGWTPTDAGILCGGMTCAPNQMCFHPCSNLADLSSPSGDGGGGGLERCIDVPASCSTYVTCGCFAPDPCSASGGTCGITTFGYVWCEQCPI